MNFRTENKVLTQFNYASLTDVVLQLLIFFLLSSAFVMQSGIRIRLPRTVITEALDRRNIVLTVTKGGELYVNNERVDLKQITAKIQPLIAKDREQPVVINADMDVTIQRTVEVIDAAKAAGAAKFLIATQPENAR
ncbi:MAG: biopolymer transporter ExbD [Ignavibacteriales bacterium CG07_land_8_20_14_0_80_59_12]|nr:MAG: biopolymer transporter ExbD [Ignavibacteriales bacterium CG07_land_8_20_14_0_80_59_12]